MYKYKMISRMAEKWLFWGRGNLTSHLLPWLSGTGSNHFIIRMVVQMCCLYSMWRDLKAVCDKLITLEHFSFDVMFNSQIKKLYLGEKMGYFDI